MGIPQGEKIEQETEEILEMIVPENFCKLMSDTKPQVLKAQRIPSRINANLPQKNFLI